MANNRRAIPGGQVFTFKGQPLNVWGLKRDIVYKNDEISEGEFRAWA